VDSLAAAQEALQRTENKIVVLNQAVADQERRINLVYADLQQKIQKQNKATRQRVAALDNDNVADELNSALSEYRSERE